ncbi:MAG: hypothetical protein DME25_09180 [Verrucomicrobia bacterium]|nr:MAG: hypothetical protein DME25_09180 [Verrucomicrobiota bacterium]
MNSNKTLQISSTLCLSLLLAQAQETNEVEQLKRQLQQLQQQLERVQREQREQIEALSKKLEELTKAKAAEAEKKKLEEQLAAELQKNPPAPAPSPTPSPATAWSPAQPLTIARAGSAYMNISFDALMDVGGPIKRGFSLRNAEIALDGAVDPYFKGFANIVLKLDKNNETEIELEETYLQTTALPANLQLKAGQFFANFGRQNPQHPHQWAFVDEPLILNRAFGPDGLRNVGGQLSWLVPTPFYTEAFLGVLDGQGGTAFSFRNPGEDDGTGTERFHGRATLDRTLRGPGDLLFVPRLASSFDLSDSQTLLVGASAAFGPNETGPDRHTQIYGVDLYWKWKPADAHAGFPFVSWQTEALYQRFEAGADLGASLPAETLEDWGFYSQALWGFKPRWVAGLRGEWVTGNHGAFDSQDVFRGERTRVSPNLTFYPSEFSKLRLQYNYDHGALFGDEHSLWLQLEFLLGAHGAHKF